MFVCGWLGGVGFLPACVRAFVCVRACVSVRACYVFAGVSSCVLGNGSAGLCGCVGGSACVYACARACGSFLVVVFVSARACIRECDCNYSFR